jgi:low temperature requirement protein LtrA
MVGISVVAPQYNPRQQVKGTFQAFCTIPHPNTSSYDRAADSLAIILMISRVALAAQYVLAALREKPQARKHVFAMAGCNAAAAIVYLGVAFRFTDSTNSRVFVTWYVAGFVETCLIFYLSHKWKGSLKFNSHTLPERMKTATLLILGEGVIVVAEHVSTVVKNVNSWSKVMPFILPSQKLTRYFPQPRRPSVYSPPP